MRLLGGIIPLIGYLRRKSEVAEIHGWGIEWLGYLVIPYMHLDIDEEKFNEYIQLECDCPECTEERERNGPPG